MPASEQLSLPPFVNEPFKDFTTEETRRGITEALAKVRSALGKTYETVIGGVRTHGTETFSSHNPANIHEVIGIHFTSDATEANLAVKAAAAAFPSWSRNLPTIA